NGADLLALRRRVNQQVRLSGGIAKTKLREHRCDVFQHEVAIHRSSGEIQRLIGESESLGRVALSLRDCRAAMQCRRSHLRHALVGALDDDIIQYTLSLREIAFRQVYVRDTYLDVEDPLSIADRV